MSSATTPRRAPVHAGADAPRFGSVEFANSCSGSVQSELSRAVAMLHSFGYERARRTFGAVTDQDPDCAIAWWGLAMTYWQPLWEPSGPNPDALRKGKEALRRAREAVDSTDRERAFVTALDEFFGRFESEEHLERVLAYERAMEDVHRRYPQDTEARVFYALALLGSATSLPPDKTYARQLKAGELLLPVFHAEPNHPGAPHYIIHAFDYPALATRALEAARRYAQIAPDSPHAQHMPSHIFTRLGLWNESIASNVSALEAARAQGIIGEELHAMDYLVFAYLQRGDDRSAEDIIAAMPRVQAGAPLYFAGTYAHAAIPARYAVERRQWSEAAQLSVPPDFPGGRYAWADAAIYFVRALGAARTGNLDQARHDLDQLAAIHETLEQHDEDYWATQVEIQRRAAEAWLTFAEGRPERALEEMRSAAALEDTTDKHPVTPGQIVPAHDLLGQMLLEMDRAREAGDEFREVLRAEPGRFGAIYGAARAAELAGDDEEARRLYVALVEQAPDSERAEVSHARAVIGVTAPESSLSGFQKRRSTISMLQ